MSKYFAHINIMPIFDVYKNIKTNEMTTLIYNGIKFNYDNHTIENLFGNYNEVTLFLNGKTVAVLTIEGKL